MRPPLRRDRVLTVAERRMKRAELGLGPLGLDPADVGQGDQWYIAPNINPLNPVELESKKRRIRAELEAGSPHDESPAYKRKRDRRIRELEESLKKDVIPHNFYHLKRQDSKDYHKVVKEIVSQTSNQNRLAMEDELKNLRRERENDDPDAGKLTYLREADKAGGII